MTWAALVSKLANRQSGQAFNAVNLGMLFIGLVLLIAAVRDASIKDTLTAMFKGELPAGSTSATFTQSNAVAKATDRLKDQTT